ncbi:hydroxyisourate hydrolase [Rhodococcus sp. NPDC047139]|uniref:hydroxyisourate hydrolase n=1 Tax=Rhodococcus sp. NPDC047139 TaxID=3155141 RepID=UPI0033E36826
MNTLSTHVLDATAGTPAVGLHVSLTDADGNSSGTGITDDDGRLSGFAGPLTEGTYHLTFATGDWFSQRGISSFYPEVTVTFRIPEGSGHFHVPLLLSPYSYSTYRGS